MKWKIATLRLWKIATCSDFATLYEKATLRLCDFRPGAACDFGWCDFGSLDVLADRVPGVLAYAVKDGVMPSFTCS